MSRSKGLGRALKEWKILSRLGTLGRAFCSKGGPLESGHQMVRLDSKGTKKGREGKMVPYNSRVLATPERSHESRMN